MSDKKLEEELAAYHDDEGSPEDRKLYRVWCLVQRVIRERNEALEDLKELRKLTRNLKKLRKLTEDLIRGLEMQPLSDAQALRQVYQERYGWGSRNGNRARSMHRRAQKAEAKKDEELYEQQRLRLDLDIVKEQRDEARKNCDIWKAIAREKKEPNLEDT